jgi:hypothetical protein
MPDEPERHPLIGLIASWPPLETEAGYWRGPGRGEVGAVLPDGYSCLVGVVPRPGETDAEPPHMLVIPAIEVGVLFFKSLEDEQTWYEWVMTDPDERRSRVVRLVDSKPKKPPKK